MHGHPVASAHRRLASSLFPPMPPPPHSSAAPPFHLLASLRLSASSRYRASTPPHSSSLHRPSSPMPSNRASSGRLHATPPLNTPTRRLLFLPGSLLHRAYPTPRRLSSAPPHRRSWRCASSLGSDLSGSGPDRLLHGGSMPTRCSYGRICAGACRVWKRPRGGLGLHGTRPRRLLQRGRPMASKH